MNLLKKIKIIGTVGSDNLFKRSDYDTKISDIDKKTNDEDHAKYILFNNRISWHQTIFLLD